MTLDDDGVVRFTPEEAAEMRTDLHLMELAAAGDQAAESLLWMSDFVKDWLRNAGSE